jgi:thiosulfate dehydrogenase [quinone] large subunit
MKHRETAYALLRVIFGMVFVTTGAVKFIGGLSGFVGGMNQAFLGKLPAAMVTPFAYAIPFSEVTVGVLILLGLFTRVGLIISGLLLIGLTFGVVVLSDSATVAHNLQYGLINFVLLWLVDLNRYSIDGLWQPKAAAGFTS